jgi:carbon-monoxide dehydrogenase large subunit
MHGSILGTRVLRTEDPELLTGAAQYVADARLDGALQLVLVRSVVAHGTITAILTDEAQAMAGVAAVFTTADLGLVPAHGFVKVHDDFARPPLAADRVRFVGEAIVAIVAETGAAGADAAAAVVVDIDPLPVLVDPERAFDDGAIVFPEHGSNEAAIIVDRHRIDLDPTSDVVVRGRYVNQRMAVVPMETNGIAVVPQASGRITVHASTQMPHVLQGQLAAALGIEPSRVRIAPLRVGGGFGGKAGLYPEYTIAAAAALRLGRPVVWAPWRSEDMVALHHSRSQVQYAELGLRRDGTFCGLRVRLVGDAGAYPGVGAYLPGGTRRMAPGPYHIPAMQFDVAVAVTNTTPMGAYRGAGRPEATALIERLVDQAAIELRIDPIELRLRNLVGDDEFPFRSLGGNRYDSGRYARALTTAARLAGYDELRAEQEARRERGDLLGIGVAAYVEITDGGGTSEFGAVEVHADGTATVRAGTFSHGQGHQTAFAMLVAEQTGIPVDRIRLVDGDTDAVPTGGGTGGLRSLQLGGSTVHRATEVLVDRARRLAAHLLGADVADIVVDTTAGTVGVAGVPASSLTWAELAAAAATTPDGIVDDGDGSCGLAAQLTFDQGTATFPFGAHVAVVEVDRDTGRVRLVRHIAVDDCGRVLNPLLVEGQQHGGVAAGVGQALFEEVRFDADGNPLTATLVDYTIPTAAELPSFEVSGIETPTPLNPLGAKGIGEAATIGSTPAVQNAVIDAVAPPPRPAVHTGASVAGDPRRPDRHTRRPVARTAGDLRADEHTGGGRRRGDRRRTEGI